MAKFCVVTPDGIDEDTKREFREQFAAGLGCRWCGGLHPGECPRVKRVVFHPSDERQVREIEFWGDADWSKANIVFPEDVV